MRTHEDIRTQVDRLIFNIVREQVKKRSDVLNPLFNENIEMLMSHEVKISPGEKHRVDAIFGGKIVFEFKTRESEFDSAVEKAREVYLPKLPNAKYFIITNYDNGGFLKLRTAKRFTTAV